MHEHKTVWKVTNKGVVKETTTDYKEATKMFGRMVSGDYFSRKDWVQMETGIAFKE